MQAVELNTKGVDTWYCINKTKEIYGNFKRILESNCIAGAYCYLCEGGVRCSSSSGSRGAGDGGGEMSN